jgi:serine phosphatase RsbU (regulator of sigma subunit)
MEVRFAAAKIGKYASRESGDTLEMTERPHGGLSLVLVDGQRSGHSAKAISNVVARKAVQLLAEGVRDGAAARAAHDYLYTYRKGKVSATLNILSVDTRSKTLVVSRNNPAPVIVHSHERGCYLLDGPSSVVGVNRNVKPDITEIPLTPETLIVVYTDGLQHAGSISGTNPFDPQSLVSTLLDERIANPQIIVDKLLEHAVALDDGRPKDDISVLAIAVTDKLGDEVRRLNGRIPF